MSDAADVTVVIPTLDEAPTIGDVVTSFRQEGYEDVLVIDGGSGDETVAAARDAGAEVRQQSGTGKGQAVREAFGLVDTEAVLLVDGDGTYLASDADAMLGPILDGTAEHVIGNRFADMAPGAMTRLNRVGNRGINRVFAAVHGRDYADILSGYRAFSSEAIERIRLTATGFGIETEIAVECAKRGIPTAVVPISYRPRPDGTDTNLRPFRDGAVIVGTLYRLAKTSNPLFYFGSIGGASLVVAGLLGAWVGLEWFVDRTPHQVLTVVVAVLALFGVQLLTFGVLSDMVVSLRRYDGESGRIDESGPETPD